MEAFDRVPRGRGVLAPAGGVCRSVGECGVVAQNTKRAAPQATRAPQVGRGGAITLEERGVQRRGGGGLADRRLSFLPDEFRWPHKRGTRERKAKKGIHQQDKDKRKGIAC